MIASEGFPEREIDAAGAGESADSFFQWGDAVIGETCGAAPDDDVATFEAVTAWAIFAGVAAE